MPNPPKIPPQKAMNSQESGPQAGANDNHPADPEPPLGTWRDSRFEFTSPATKEAWHRSAYAQGVNPENWHHGTEIDAPTHTVLQAGFGGPTPPLYRGPDGKHRYGNLKTIEPAALRDIRRRHFTGKSLDDLEAGFAATGKIPGEDEAVAHLRASSVMPLFRPQVAALSTNATAILSGMEQARRTKPDVVTTVAQAETGDTTGDSAGTTQTTSDAPLQIDPSPPTIMPSPLLRGPRPPKKPSAPIDAPRRAELIVFQPVGEGQSSFGHVAIEIDGLLYSWAPNGLHLTSKDAYLKTNSFRDGTGYPLRLTGNEVKRLESYILQYDTTAHYNPVTANCTDPIEQGLESLGYNVGLTILPAQLQKALLASQLASKETSHFYPADPARKSPPAAMPWSVMSRPE